MFLTKKLGWLMNQFVIEKLLIIIQHFMFPIYSEVIFQYICLFLHNLIAKLTFVDHFNIIIIFHLLLIIN